MASLRRVCDAAGIGDESGREARFAAVYGIVACYRAPVMVFAIRWWRTINPNLSSEGWQSRQDAVHLLVTCCLHLCLCRSCASAPACQRARQAESLHLMQESWGGRASPSRHRCLCHFLHRAAGSWSGDSTCATAPVVREIESLQSQQNNRQGGTMAKQPFGALIIHGFTSSPTV